jgi:hypothetical protein
VRQHHALAALERELGPKAVRINHEDLCTDPRATLQPVGACLGLDFDAIGAALAAGEPFKPVPHLIRGNAVLRLGRDVVLRYEPTFQNEMSGLDQAICRVAAKLPVLGH